MESRFLIALDLDGTSVRYDPRLEMDPSIVDYLSGLSSAGVQWVMNSDRFTDAMIDIAMLLQDHARPKALLSCQRFMYRLDGAGGYAPLRSWNDRQMVLHRDLWGKISPCFRQWDTTIRKKFTVLDCGINDLVFAYMVPLDEVEPLRALMADFVNPWSDAQISGNHEWTFIVHSAFSKGRLLSAYAETAGVMKDNIIAIGDGLNDLTMLDGSVTGRVGCPANASREIVAAVTAAGGVVADREGPDGTLQILRHYLDQERMGEVQQTRCPLRR